MSRKGWALFAAMGIIWGLPYLLIKVSVREVAPPMLVEMRTGGGALLLLPITLHRGEMRRVIRRFWPLLGFAVSETALPWLFLFNAERKLSSSLSGLLVAAVPLVGTVLGRVTGADRLDRRRFVGVLIGLGGVAALVGFDVGRADIWSAASLGVVAVGYAIGPWILSRYLADLPGLGVITICLALCALIYAPLAAFAVPARSLSLPVIGSVAGLTVVCTSIAFVIFFALIAEVGPMRATVITYVNPAVAVVLGVGVLGERFGLTTAFGFALIVVGCLLATGRGGRSAPETSPSVPASAEPACEQRATP